MRVLLTAAMVLGSLTANSQSCSAPKPLSAAQVSMVKGEWKGHYDLKGERTEFAVIIASENNPFTRISAPPLDGEPMKEEYRFCGGGAFHFKKKVAGGFYEFDGVPEGNTMNGTLVVEWGSENQTGTFAMTRSR